MKFLFASDSFKGSLSSQKTAELLAKAAREIFPDCQCDSIVVADGGEGTTRQYLRLQMEKNYLCKFMDLSGRILQVIMACWMKIVQ